MKTGIVVQINKKSAVILQSDGVFTEQKTEPGWVVGSVVVLQNNAKTNHFRRYFAAAACIVLAVVTALFVNGLYFQRDTVISLDFNPSFEIELNRQGKVIRAVAYNDVGTDLLSGLDLKWKTYEEALSEILQNEKMRVYLLKKENLEVSVYTAGGKDDTLNRVKQLINDKTKQYKQIQVKCTDVSKDVVEQAHTHGMTAGKWSVLLELQAIDPTIDIEEYCHESIGTIRKHIREHAHNNKQGQDSGNHHNNTDNSNSNGSHKQKGKHDS